MGKNSSKHRCYCAFCKQERPFYDKKHLGFLELFMAALVSVSLSLLFFQMLSEYSALFFIVFLMVTEVFHQVRWRMFIVCPYCGFDPVLYARDPKLAADKVKENLVVYKDNPMKLLSKNNPYQNLPIRRVKPEPEPLSK